jgi:hypothetical protein
MVVWIETEMKSVSSHKERSSEVKTFSFDDKTIFDRFPKFGKFTLVIARYDFLSPVMIGYDRYKECTVVNYEEKSGNISIKVHSDGFYNKSQMAELRADRIESLLF